MKKVLCAMMLFAAAILCLHQNVSAAEGATVTVNGDTLQAGSDAWKVTLDISGDTKITNGKILAFQCLVAFHFSFIIVDTKLTF